MERNSRVTITNDHGSPLQISIFENSDAFAEQQWNEHTLAAPVSHVRAMLWLYRNSGVVLGAGQRIADKMHLAADRQGIDLLRRGSGGGAVLTGPHLLSLSLILPPAHPLAVSGVSAAYRWLGRIHQAALQHLGIRCESVSSDVPKNAMRSPAGKGVRARLAWACFGSVSVGEVLTQERNQKLVGLAQRRRRTGVLLTSGTNVTEPDWDLLCRVFGESSDRASDLREASSSCTRELGSKVPLTTVAHELVLELAKAFVALDTRTGLTPAGR